MRRVLLGLAASVLAGAVANGAAEPSAPPGAGTSTLSPTFLPISARARGEEMEMLPTFISAS